MEPLRLQCGQDRLYALGHGRQRRIDSKLRLQRRLVGMRNAGKIGNLTGPRALVEALGVARFADGQRGIDEHLQEFPLAHQSANQAPVLTERRNEGGDHHQPRVQHQVRRFADATNILYPVGFRESQVSVETVPDVVAIQQHRMHTHRVQARLQGIGNRRLSHPAEPGQPNHLRRMTLDRGARIAVHGRFVPNHFPYGSRCRHAGAFGTVRITIDKNQTTGFDGIAVRIYRDRPLEDDFAASHVVAVQARGFVRFERAYVQMLNQPYGSRYRGAADLQIVTAPGEQRRFRHPNYVGFQEVGDCRRGIDGLHEPVTAGHVELAVEDDGHRLARARLLQIAVEGADPLDSRLRIGRQDPDGVAYVQRCADDLSGDAAEVLIRTVKPLSYQAEGHALVEASGRGFQRLQNGAPPVPRGVGRVAHHVAAIDGTDRDYEDFGQAQL